MDSDDRRRNNNSLASAVVLSGASIAFAVWLCMLLNFQLFDRSVDVHRSADVVSSPAFTNSALPTNRGQQLVVDPAKDDQTDRRPAQSPAHFSGLDAESRESCRRTCKLEIVESIPENLTFSSCQAGHYPPTMSTYEAWKRLIQLAENEIVMAAYKSSLRGKHVLDEPSPSAKPGEKIYDQLKKAALEGGVHIYAVENDPPKDPGDNADALSLARAGALERRSLHMDRVLENAGVMHSKFFIVDNRHLYLGSANFDWRSLNQKMELGLLVTDCPCLAADLRILFDTYWTLAADEDSDCPDSTRSTRDHLSVKASSIASHTALTNLTHPLTISYGETELDVYLAASPRDLNGAGRSWDLEAIVDVIDGARTFLYVNVMDYIPMIVYQKPRRFWPVIDDAIRRAVVERGVDVRILTAALHFAPESLGFLESLQIIGQGLNKGSINVRILTVPVVTPFHHLIARDRRTHRKFVVTDDAVVVGTSNWSGDYFTSTTGAAIIVKQRASVKSASQTIEKEAGQSDQQKSTGNRTLIEQMRGLFLRDYESSYARDLHDYVRKCFDPVQRRDLCRPEKKSKQAAKVN